MNTSDSITNFASGDMTSRMAGESAIVGTSPTRSQSLGDSRSPAHPPTGSLSGEGEYFTARVIGKVCNVHKKTVARHAELAQWPSRQVGNRTEYQPPAHIAALIVATPSAIKKQAASEIQVRYINLPPADPQRENVLLREKAVQLLNSNATVHGKEMALQLVCNHFAEHHKTFSISISSLRRWDDRYKAHGLDGLVEQKRGIVGRKPFADDLTESQILRGQALSLGHGIKGRQNFAHAFRKLTADPTIHGKSRDWLHQNRASKSSVPPSVRKALTVSKYAAKLIQVGPRAAELDGPHSIGDYSKGRFGRAFTADDMTANVYVWVEWPNEDGYIVVRPQILAAMDVDTQAWLCVRAIIRSKGQYNKDDVWGLIGDVLENFGKFEIAVLEGGIWQSNVVVGQKISDSERMGGLRAMGIKVIHTRSPRGKIIETNFDELQLAGDNCKGYCGREERKDCPEPLKKQMLALESRKLHPSQFLLSLDQYNKHLENTLRELNDTRKDGPTHRGLSPAELVAEQNVELPQFPAEAQWMYRSDYRQVTVTKNGVRIQIASGKYAHSYSYYSADLEIHRGRKVVVFWNDYNPDTDAIIYTLENGRPQHFICAAPRVQELDRFGATKEQMAAESRRKKLVARMAITKSTSLAPYLQRRQTVLPVTPEIAAVQAKIEEVKEKAQAKEQKKATVEKIINNGSKRIDLSHMATPAPSGRPQGHTLETMSNADAAAILAKGKTNNPWLSK